VGPYASNAASKLVGTEGQGNVLGAIMSEVLEDVSAPSLVAAIEANLFEFFKLFKRWPRAEVHDSLDMLWTITDIPFPLFNSVFRARLSDPDSAIEAAKDRCTRRNVPMMWWTGPSTQPADLGITLEASGFTSEESPGMAADLRSLPSDALVPTGLVIQQVADIEAVKKWCHVLCVGFEMPDFVGGPLLDLFSSVGFDSQSMVRHYVGRLNGDPVSVSSMFLGAGVAGIYNVATVPKARKRGVGSAMTLMPLREARGLGYQTGILHSSHMAVNVYHRLGFREYCKLLQYVWPSRQVGK
jgi:GNAT superfamily N-acetyltransferase